jgi:hypothetical protein
MSILLSIGAVTLGFLIGYGFGTVQRNALHRNQKLQESGKLTNGWNIMPSSMRRVFFLVIGLVAIQILFPLFFSDTTTQWLISGGIIIGYGLVFVQRLRMHRQIHA